MLTEDLCFSWKRADRGPGHIYLIRPVLEKDAKWFNNEETCPVKIGVSKDEKGVSSRLKSLKTGNWNSLCVESISPKLLEPYNVEYTLKSELFKRKLHGEWFAMTFEECNHLKEMLIRESVIYEKVPWVTCDLRDECLTEKAYDIEMWTTIRPNGAYARWLCGDY